MNVALLLATGLMTLSLLSSCQKERLARPAVYVTIHSQTIPSEDNGYLQNTATVQLHKRDGSYKAEKFVTGSGYCSFEDLSPGDYWINEKLTRHSSDITVRPDEVTEFQFTIP